MSKLNFDYVPLTFISDKQEIKKQIRNTLILIHLFEKYNNPVRLEKLIEGTQYGYNASALQLGQNKFLRISDIHESKVNWDTVPYCNCDDEETYLLKNEDILIARTGGTTGKSFKIDSPPKHSIYAGYLIRIRAKNDVNPEYIYLFLHSFAYWSQIVNLNERNFRPKANAENLKSLVLPDCERSIQDEAVRISQGENIMGYEYLFSKIEKVLSEYDKMQQVENLLADQIKHLENLNQAILQEAVQGKLVKQDPKDEPASELLKCIKTEKAKSGKKEKPLPVIKPEEIPFEIPKNWVWCRLGEICDINPRNKADDNIETGFIPMPLVSQLMGVKPSYEIRTWGSIKKGFTHFANNDVVVAKITPCFENSKAGIISDLPNGIGAGTTELNVLRGNGFIIPEYIYSFIKRIDFIKNGKSLMKGVSGQQRVPTEYFHYTIIPLPPLSEQKRIVVEIEKQLAQTKQLKEYIVANQQATEQLLKALLHQAFEVKEKKEKAVEQPKGKVIELKPNKVNLDNLAAEPFEKYAAHPVNNIQDIDWEIALMVACIETKLGVTYGDVGLQKNVYNTNNIQPIFSKQYAFVNSNFGTFSYELKDDLKRNPYLISRKVANNKEVYVVNSKYKKKMLAKLSAPENREFIKVINSMLSIYEHHFINKETDKIELYNTVLKVAIDKKSKDIEVIYQGMKDWHIKQKNYKTKAEKFSMPHSERMLKLLIDKKIIK